MHRRVLPLLALCCVPVLLQAGEIRDMPLVCAPAGAVSEPPVFEPAKSRPLTYEEQRDLHQLFAALEGSWHGSLVEQVCMLSGNTREHPYDATMTIKALHDGLQLTGDYVRPQQHVRRRFSLRLFLTPDGLRVDQRSRGGEVELLQANRQLLDYVRYYRSVHEQDPSTPPPADQSGIAVVPNAVAGTANLEAQVVANDAPGAPSKRTALAHQQRVILEMPSSRELRLTQHFVTQGVYGGNMAWRLRRD